MIRNWIDKIRGLKSGALFRGVWLKIHYAFSGLMFKARMFWAVTDRGAWLFFSALGLGFLLLGILVYTAIEGEIANRDLNCLARNVYYEARGEPEKGQLAVAKVTLNRVASKRFPDSVCEVVYEKRWDKRRRRYVGAFSWTELDRLPKLKSRLWRKAWKAAEEVYDNPQSVDLKGALYFHATRIKPRWAKQKQRIRKIGRHIFYK